MGWELESDSLMNIHKNRWKWDFAIGGFYKANADSVWITVKAARLKGNKIVTKKKRVMGEIRQHLNLCSDLFYSLLSLIDYKISQEDSLKLRKAATRDNNVYATYAMGYGYEMHDEISSAISAYSRVVEMDNRFAPAMHRIGMLYSRARKKEEAQKYLDKAVSLSPKSSVYAAGMAELLMYGKAPEKAISFIDSKRSLLEKTVAGMKAIGMAYILNGEYQRAVSVLTRAVAAGPSDLETDFILGRVYLSLGQFTTAADIFGRLIKYRPQYTRYYSFLGEAYREAGRLMESSDVLETAMKLDPYNVPNLLNLANTYFRLGWYQKAEQYLIRARDLNPDMGEILINLGVLYWHMNKRGNARKMFNLAVEKNINVQSALNNQANILFLSGNVKKAIKMYKRADKSGKKSEVILYNLALAYLSAGKVKDAIAYLDEVMLISPDRLDVLIMQAQLAVRREKIEDAELYYRKILDLSPGHRETIIKLTALFEKQERYEDAIKIVEEYLNDFPQDLTFRLRLPDLYRKRGWYEVALSEYQNMLQDRSLKNSAKVWLGIGQSQYDIIRFKGGRDYEKAIYNLKKAIELDPRDPEPDIIIGSIYMYYKNYRDLAMEHWNKAYNKASTSAERKRIKELIAGKKQ
jgi:tetratricopeptide (TPR) repeat protein